MSNTASKTDKAKDAGVDPAEAEVSAPDTVTVEGPGGSYDLPGSAEDWPFAITKAGPAETVDLLLGPEDSARFWAANPTMGQANKFMADYCELIGLDVGELLAS